MAIKGVNITKESGGAGGLIGSIIGGVIAGAATILSAGATAPLIPAAISGGGAIGGALDPKKQSGGQIVSTDISKEGATFQKNEPSAVSRATQGLGGAVTIAGGMQSASPQAPDASTATAMGRRLAKSKFAANAGGTMTRGYY